ncbi:MAG: type II secretion system protein [Phycisphaerales bacterium]
MRTAFTLIELLVVIAVIAVLIGVLIPALSRAREAGRAVNCLANLKNSAVILQAYADEQKGFSPAIGWPYDRAPHWAVVVQNSAGLTSSLASETRPERSILVCPSASAFHGRAMLRTYAINATGHAAQPGDPDNYEPAPGDPNPRPTHIRMANIQFPGQSPLLTDSTSPPQGAVTTPTLLCASLIDYRQPAMVDERLGLYHASRASTQACFADGSAHLVRIEPPGTTPARVPGAWLTALP